MERTIKILSWNINGLKSTLNPYASINHLLQTLSSDIVCFQETKLPVLNESRLCIADDFYSYFSCCRSQQPYSGTATFVRKSIPCVRAQEGLSGLIGCYSNRDTHERIILLNENELGITFEEALQLDSEGRVVITDHVAFVLINVYCPFANLHDEERFAFKMKFKYMLTTCICALRARGRQVVLVGDLNISAYPIDHCSPESFVITREFRSTIPSAPEGCGESHSSKNKDRVRLIDVDTFAERPHNKWIVDLITRVGMVDSFRLLHPERKEAYTCWDNLTGARKTNYGTRIDYILVSDGVLGKSYPRTDGGDQLLILDAEIEADIMGSDHCPVSATLTCLLSDCDCLSSPPELCTSHIPGYMKKQLGLSDFFTLASGEGRRNTGNGAGCTPPVRADGLSTQSPCEPTRINVNDSCRSLPSNGATTTNKRKRVRENRSFKSGQKQSCLTSLMPKKLDADKSQSVSLSAWNCSACTYENSESRIGGAIDVLRCEMCNTIKSQPSIEVVSQEQDHKNHVGFYDNRNSGAMSPSSHRGPSLHPVTVAAPGSTNAFNLLRESQKRINVPLCTQHNLPCTVQVVLKDGINKGRRFFCCSLPAGGSDKPNSRCSYFKWDESFKQLVKTKQTD